MADNHNKNGFEDDAGDFDFGDIEDWEDEGKGQAAAPANPQPKAEADPFGEDAFGADDDIFGAPAAPSASKDPFADDAFAGTDDPFGDDGLDFQQMPTPEMASRQAQPAGDPDEEFGDLGGFADEEDDVFASPAPSARAAAADPFADEEDAPAHREADPFADDGHSDPFADDAQEDAPGRPYDDGEDDPFGAEEEEQAPAAAPAAARSRPRSGLVFPLALAAVLAGVAYVGYVHVLPGFLSGGGQPVVATGPEKPAEPSFPTALPNQPGGLALPEQPAPANPGLTLPVVPEVPVTQPPALADGGPAVTQPAPAMPGLGPVTQPPALPHMPGHGTTVVGENPALIGELSGEDGRGGIVRLREPEVPAAQPDIVRIEARIEAIERKVEELVTRLDSALLAPEIAAPVAFPAFPVRAPSAPAAEAGVPPLKPEIVETATLKGVSRGLAWVSTPSGVVEVKVGDTVPGAGTVTAVREYEGQWIVVTTSGLILQ